MNLRSKLIRLAYRRPDLRSDLLPLIKNAGFDEDPRNMWVTLKTRAKSKDGHTYSVGDRVWTFWAGRTKYSGNDVMVGIKPDPRSNQGVAFVAQRHLEPVASPNAAPAAPPEDTGEDIRDLIAMLQEVVNEDKKNRVILMIKLALKTAGNNEEKFVALLTAKLVHSGVSRVSGKNIMEFVRELRQYNPSDLLRASKKVRVPSRVDEDALEQEMILWEQGRPGSSFIPR